MKQGHKIILTCTDKVIKKPVVTIYIAMYIAMTNRLHIILHTIELRLGQNTSSDRKTILPIADIKGRDGRMVGHLVEEKERDRQQKESVRYSLSCIHFTLAAFHGCVHCVFVE